MKQIVRLRLSTLVLLILAGAAYAQSQGPTEPEPVVLTDEQGKYPLGLHLEFLEDPGGELTIDEVSSPEYDSQFTSSQVEVPNFGFTDSAYWVRFQLDNQTRQTTKWLLEQGFANTHYVDLYSPTPGGVGFTVKQTGVLRPPATRDVSHPRIIIMLTIPPESQQTYYLRFQNGASMTLPLTLWAQEAFLNDALLEQIANGIFFGVLIGLLFYNLFLFFSLRDRNYLYFVILLASLIVEEASYDGYLVVYVIPNLNFINKYAEPLSFAMLTASMIVFSDSFLEIKTRLPNLHKANLGLLALWGMLAFLSLFASYHFIANLMAPTALLSLLVIFNAGIASWLRGFRPTRFFMIAWLGLLASVSWVLLVRLGLTSSTLFSENAFRLGYLWMAVCWSIALADRINLLKAETESANRELRNSEHRLSQILEGLPIGVVVYGKDQRPTYGNQRTVDILGNPTRQILPDVSARRTLTEALRYYSFRITGSGQDYPLEKFPVYNALQGEPASADDIEADLIDRRVPLEIWASPVRDADGNIESAVVAFQDITERKKVEGELDSYRNHLEQLVNERTAELNREADERKMLEGILYRRIAWLSAVKQAQQSIKSTADLPQADEQLIHIALNLLDARAVFLQRWDGPAEQAEVLCTSMQSGLPPDIQKVRTSFLQDLAETGEIEPEKTLVVTPGQTTQLSTLFGACFLEEGFQSLLLAPLNTRQTITGMLGVALMQPQVEVNPHQIAQVEKMALDLADLMEDAIFLEQSRALVAAEERNRLARDLHDSVTQVLFSANLLAEVLPQIWRRDPEQGLERLEKLQRLTRGALAEMRTLLLELRPSAIANTPLGELLAQLTEAVTSRSGLPFQLYIERIPSLPEEVHTNFYRIAQEALNNVVKHAQAENVSVSLSESTLQQDLQGSAKHEVKLVIGDDGVGFSSGERAAGHLGIGIMRERAASIKADLSLESRPGYGTKVTLIWKSDSGFAK